MGSLICLIFALVLFIIAGVGVDSGRYNLIAFGLAFLTASFILTSGVLH